MRWYWIVLGLIALALIVPAESSGKLTEMLQDHRVWVAGGYSGHGNVLGFACGALVADAILGDTSSPQLQLFDPARFFAD